MSHMQNLIKSILITLVYLTTVFFIGVFLVWVINSTVLLYDLTSATGLIATIAIFAIYVGVDFGLFYLEKVTPAIVCIAFCAAPFIAVYNLFKDSGIIINREIPSRMANYVSFKMFLDSFCH